jgi:Secretion system C-terminal sorting domain/Leucine Rich repeats (2 copies)
MKNLLKKILLLALFVVCSIFTAQAQYVTIPDANFRAFLQGQYPACFNTQGEMDTTCNAVMTATNLDCSNRNITSIEGVQYFNALQELTCSNNQLVNLPTLPLYLIVLSCDNNQLTSLPALSNALLYLSCSYNQLTSLPTLPADLQNLICNNNQLTSLPSLPVTLRNLQCNYNQLTSLPTLPATLQNLQCNYNSLTSLPALPPALQSLYCPNNQLTSLPALPATLQYLYCSSNQLTSLPALPAALGQLNCDTNQLTSLPALPVSLEYLWCYNNQLTSLPDLPPVLQTLDCSDNPLTCLPFLPSSLSNLYCTPIVICLPNHPNNNLVIYAVQNSAYTQVTLPLCLPNNLNGCLSAARIFGKAYTDTDNTCTVTGTDNLQQNLLVKAVNTTTQQVFVGTSDENGFYEIAVPIGDYAVSVVPPSAYWSVCGGVQTVVITQDGQQEQRDVLVKPIVQCADMEIDHQLQNIARPCSTAVYKIAYFNGGTIPSAGAFAQITLPSELTITSVSRPYTALGGGVFEVQLPSVAALARDTFSLSANVSCSAAMNQMLCTEVEILPHTFCNAGLSGWDGSDIELTGRCVGQDSIRFIITNTGNGGMATGRTYGVVEDNVMIRSSTFQLPVGGKDSITVAADPLKIYRMIADEAPNNPSGNTQETFLVWGCHGINPQIHWGFVNQFGLNNGTQNPHSLCTPVRTSFDPNDIAATPEGTSTQHFILKNTDLEYKIRFQNTGNDTAFVVRIIDKIPAELDLTTLRIGSASHPMTYSLKANGTLEFLFQNIRLEDSTSNEAKSHGFVTYKIKTKPNIVTGSIINNQAFIYFDANAPVATNIYTHTIGENLTTIFISTIEVVDNTEFSVKIMPNPMHDAAVFEIGDSQSPRDIQLTLYNTLGQAVKTQRFIDGKLVLERDNLPQGCYFYKITSEGKMMAQGKVVIAP